MKQMERRKFLKMAGATAIAVGLTACGGIEPSAPSSSHPSGCPILQANSAVRQSVPAVLRPARPGPKRKRRGSSGRWRREATEQQS